MRIELANFEATDFQALLRDHLTSAGQNDCTHALGLAALQNREVQMFTARTIGGDLMGFAALKKLSETTGEIKSVRTHPDFLRQGVSRALMLHLQTVARDQLIESLYLETHSTPSYKAACRLYENLGFETCGPFADYIPTPESVFMRKCL